MSKTLSMSFLTTEGKKSSISVGNVKDDVSQADVKSTMDMIVAKNIFSTKNGDIQAVDSASIIDRTTTQLDIK